MSEEPSMADLVNALKESMQDDFDGAEQEGFNIGMKTIYTWAKTDAQDWELLATTLGETGDGLSSVKMAAGFNQATSAFQGALVALEFAGVIE